MFMGSLNLLNSKTK